MYLICSICFQPQGPRPGHIVRGTDPISLAPLPYEFIA